MTFIPAKRPDRAGSSALERPQHSVSLPKNLPAILLAIIILMSLGAVAQAAMTTTANRVYGQQGDFGSNTINNSGLSAGSLKTPGGIAVDSNGGVYIADTGNNRVLYYASGSITATRVYGQPDFASSNVNNGGISATSLSGPLGVAVDSSGGLYVADTGNNRVLYYASGSITATRVYGQVGSFTSTNSNNGGISATSLAAPQGLTLDSNNNLYIADTNNNRVLYYPSGNVTATLVYGQFGQFNTSIANNSGISANTLSSPRGVAVDSSGSLYIADTSNNRVLYYTSGSPTAVRVYGQPDYSSSNINNGGLSAISLKGPVSVAVKGTSNLFISDQGNQRVLYYSGTSTTASIVYGQNNDFTSSTANNGGVSATSLSGPGGIVVDSAGGVYVADKANNRALYYPNLLTATTLNLSSNPNPAAAGQSVTFTATLNWTAATGNVVFQEGSQVLGSSTLTSGLATYSTSGLSAGSHVISATYSGDNNYSASSSQTITQVVVAGPPAVVVAKTGNNQSTVVSTTFAAPLVAQVQDSVGNPVSSVVVTLTAPASGATGTFAGGSQVYTGTTDSSGTVTSTVFKANTIAGSYAVTAKAAGVVTSTSFSLTNRPGPAQPPTITGGNLQQADVATPFALPLAVKINDAYNNPISDSQVVFTAPTSGPSGSFSNGLSVYTGTTNASGLVTTTTFTANTVAGGYSVVAQVVGGSSQAFFALGNNPGPASQLIKVDGDNQQVVVANDFGQPLTIRVTDQFGNNVAGETVTFTLPSSGPGGTFPNNSATYSTFSDLSGLVTSAALTANTQAGNFLVIVSSESGLGGASFSLTNLPDEAFSLRKVSGDSQSASLNTAFGQSLVVEAKDRYGNLAVGSNVTFSAPASGPGGTFSGGDTVYQGTVNNNGVVSTPTFTANNIAGTYNVIAFSSTAPQSVSFSLTNTPGAPANLLITSGNNQSAQNGTPFVQSFQVKVTDGFNNPLSGITVTFAAPASGPSGSFAGSGSQFSSATDASGLATAPLFTANSQAGSYNVTASVSGLVGPAFFNLTNLVGAPGSISVVSGNNQSAPVNNPFGQPLVVRVSDASNNPISGQVVTFTAPTGQNATGTFAGNSSVYTATTNASGVVTSSLITANAVAGSYSVQAATFGVSSPATFNLTNLAGAAATVTILSGNNQSAQVNANFSLPLVVRVSDASNNPVGGQTVTFSAPGSGASGTFNGDGLVFTGTTSASGVVTSSVFKANAIAGSYSVTVAAGAVQASFSLTNTAVACNPFQVVSALDDGSCGSLRQALLTASTSPTKTVTINLPAGSVISFSTGLTLTNGVTINTTASCGPNGVPPITLKGSGVSNGNGLTLAANNHLYGLWVRGFSGVQIKAPAGSHTVMRCVKASKS